MQQLSSTNLMTCCYFEFELLLGTWPSACYQRVDVLSQPLDSSLHVGSQNYQSSPTRRARTENKKVNDYYRSPVNTREVSEGSMGVTGTLGPALLMLMARCKTCKTLYRQEPVLASTAVLPHTLTSRLLGQRLCDSMRE